MKDGSKYEFCRAAMFEKKDKPVIVITLKIVLPVFFLGLPNNHAWCKINLTIVL